MKLDPDCVRSIILFLEESDETIHLMRDICNALPKYESRQIYYAVDRLVEGGYINAYYFADGCLSRVETLTFEGHKLADAFHDDTIWKKTLKHAKNLGVTAIPHLLELAIDAIKNITPLL